MYYEGNADWKIVQTIPAVPGVRALYVYVSPSGVLYTWTRPIVAWATLRRKPTTEEEYELGGDTFREEVVALRIDYESGTLDAAPEPQMVCLLDPEDRAEDFNAAAREHWEYTKAKK